MNIEHSTALVTGANRGIGLALVRALVDARVGKVYAAARDAGSLAAALAIDPKRVVPLALDITDRGAVARAAEAAADATLLVNNAGVLDFGSILEVSDAAIERNLATNYLGTLAMARAFAPVIERNGGGAIVNLLTLVALASMPGLAAYNAAKAAAWSMTQSLRAGLAARGIAVVGVFPAGVDTDMLAGVDAVKADPRDVARHIVEGIATGVEDIFPDPVSTGMYAAWRKDHKAVERQFASM